MQILFFDIFSSCFYLDSFVCKFDIILNKSSILCDTKIAIKQLQILGL